MLHKYTQTVVSLFTVFAMWGCGVEPATTSSADSSPSACATWCDDRCPHEECADECVDNACDEEPALESSTLKAVTTHTPLTCQQWCFEQCHEPGTPISDAVVQCFDTCKKEICKGKTKLPSSTYRF